MTQALLFINGDTVNHMVSADGGLVDRLVKAGKPDSEILDTLYWTALGRPASAAERESDIAAIRSAQKAPQSAPAAESKAAAVTNSGKAAVQTPSVAASNGNKVAQSRTLTAAGGKRKLALTGSLSTTSPTAALARGGTEVAGSSAEMRAASQKLTSAAGTGKLAVGAPVLGGDAKNADFAPHDPAARRRVFEDMLWALVNSKEFLFNH